MIRLVLVGILLLVIFQSKASHVMGGHLEVEQLSTTSFKLDFIGYIDCQNGYPGMGLGSDTVRVFENGTNRFVRFIHITSLTKNPTEAPIGNGCYDMNLCTQEWTFTNYITLPQNANGYYITYDVCCRNSVIDNIIYPTFNGHTFYVQIPPSSIPNGNSSPKFNPFYKEAYFCVDKEKCYDLSGYDVDGDSLVYYLVNPLDEDRNGKPFNLLVWENGYHTNNPLGPGSIFSLNSQTGELCAKASNYGVYVFSILIEEYRNGVKIGEVIRDLQWRAITCKLVPDIEYPFKQDTLEFQISQKLCYNIIAQDNASLDTIAMSITTNADVFSFELPNPISPNIYEFTYFDTNINSLKTVNTYSSLHNNTFYGVGIIGGKFCWTPTNCDFFGEEDIYINIESHPIKCVDLLPVKTKVNMKLVLIDSTVIVPNVFSPNGDGKNDFYELSGVYNKCYDFLSVDIYNRWGNKVYYSNNPTFKWDGKNINNGLDVGEGTYYVILNGVFGLKNITNRFPINLFR